MLALEVLAVVRKLLSERPILIGGLGLAASLSLLGGLHTAFADSTTLASLIAVGAGVWWWRRQPVSDPATPVQKPAAPVERDTVVAAIAALRSPLEKLETELAAANSDEAESTVAEFEHHRQRLLQELDRASLKVAIAGYPRAGKSTLRRHLTPSSSADSPTLLVLSEYSLTAESPHPEIMAELLLQQDAVVYLVTEDLTDSVLTDLKTLAVAGQRVIVGLNKQDNFLPDDGATVLEQIRARLKTLPQTVEGVAIATAPRPIKVRTHDDSGQITERLEQPLAEVSHIAAAIATWTTDDLSHLVAQTVMRQTRQLGQDIQQALNRVRHQQALPVVEQLQWAAAASAFASPVPSLDLLATIAVNGQLVMDLGRVYQQPLALDQAKAIASELAGIIVKLGLVEVSTQLLTATLKSHAATYVVGGSVQGLSAAYLTRLSGESLMAYFEDRALSGRADTVPSAEAIGQKLQSLLPTTQRTEFLQTLVKQGMQRLFPRANPVLPAGSAVPLDISKVSDMPETSTVSAAVHPETVSSGDPA